MITHRLTRFAGDRGFNSWERLRVTGLEQCSSAQFDGGARRIKGVVHFKVLTDEGEVEIMYHPRRYQLRLKNGKDNKPRQWIRKPGNDLIIDKFFSKVFNVKVVPDGASQPSAVRPQFRPEPQVVRPETSDAPTQVIPPEVVSQLAAQAPYVEPASNEVGAPQPAYHGLPLTNDGSNSGSPTR